MSREPENPSLSSIEIKEAVEEATYACGYFKDRYGKCYKNWQKTSLMRGGDMRYVCEEFYDEFRACIVEHLAARGIPDVPFFGVSQVATQNHRNS
jgi:TRIAP1/MDM35 family protein